MPLSTTRCPNDLLTKSGFSIHILLNMYRKFDFLYISTAGNKGNTVLTDCGFVENHKIGRNNYFINPELHGPYIAPDGDHHEWADHRQVVLPEALKIIQEYVA